MEWYVREREGGEGGEGRRDGGEGCRSKGRRYRTGDGQIEDKNLGKKGW